VLATGLGSTAPIGRGGAHYRVVRGDTLSAIARKYGTSVDAIYNADDIIQDPNLIQPGLGARHTSRIGRKR
jgi:LysM repeat protein